MNRPICYIKCFHVISSLCYLVLHGVQGVASSNLVAPTNYLLGGLAQAVQSFSRSKD